MKEEQGTAQENPSVGLLDWCFTAPFLLVFVGILLLSDLWLRLFSKRHEAIALQVNRMLCTSLRLTGARVEIEGQLDLPEDRPLIVVSNHQSLMDIPLLGAAFGRRHLRYVSKRELGRWLPFVSINLRAGGHALIDRSDAKQSLAEIQRLGKDLAQQRFGVSIFPEGTRARGGSLKRFRGAGVLSLLKAVPEAAIVPVAIDGSWKLAAHRLLPVPRGVRLHLVIGEAVQLADFDSGAALVRRMEDVIRAELARLRSEKGEEHVKEEGRSPAA